MIGIQTENNIWTGYLLYIFIIVTGFAIYDVLYRRVPNRALVFFIPFASLAPILQAYFILKSNQMPFQIFSVASTALFGMLFGFCIPLVASIATNNGIGGGDIKFCGIIGLIYGPFGMILVFLTATIFAMPMILSLRYIFRNTLPVSVPFLPFLACGCCVATLVQLL